MSRISPALGRVTALVSALALSSSLLSAQCRPDPNVGANLALTDDSLSAQQALGFSFPFAGSSYDAVYVSSNGFVYLFDTAGSLLPPTNSQCCTNTVAALLASTSPMVCGLWQDLNPGAGGSVHFNTLPGRALITWQAVPEYGQASTNTFQIGLSAGGSIDLLYGARGNVAHNALIGWSPGSGAIDPGTSDLSSLPIVAMSPTVYERFVTGGLDVRGAINAISVGGTGWVLSSAANCATTSTYGSGCPKPSDFYELFNASAFDLSAGSLQFIALPNGSYQVISCPANCFDAGFSNNLNLTDDSIAAGQNLGFSFPYPGGATTAITVCSNGYLWLQSGASTSADFSPTVAEFLSQPARLAPLWTDLDPTSGGGVYFDVAPGKAMVTWSGVPAYGVAGSSNTFQVQMFPNGDFILAWPQVINNSTTGGLAVTGFSRGSAVGDPGSTDLSAVPYATGSGNALPLRLDAQVGSQPALGTVFTMEMRNVTAGTIVGLCSLGVANPNIDLTPSGLPGCALLSSLNVTLSFATVAPLTTFSLPIPSDNSLIGGRLSTQAILIDLAITPVPAYLSNGLVLGLGL